VNSLKASFLLAAAATAAQLDAKDFKLSWSGATLGNAATATGVISLDLTILTSTPNIRPPQTTMNSAVTGLTVTVANAGAGSGTFVLSDFQSLRFYTGSPVDFNTELVGQNGGLFTTHIAGTFTDDFNIIRKSTSPNAPTGNLPSRLLTSSGLAMDLVSFSPSGVADFADWMSSVNNQSRVFNAGVTLASLPLEGAHHRPMMSFDRMGKDSQFWATGDFGSSSRVRDVKVTSGEVGVNKDIGPNSLAGFAIGRGQQNQDLALDGSNNVIGNYFLGEIDYRPFGSQWIVSLLGMVGSWDAKINRGYSNGGSTDYSLGQTDIITRSARLRVDAPVLFSVAGFGFSPYASYAVTQTTVDAYTENGGGLPASYDEQQHNATEARLGMMATNVINAKTKLIISLEGIHRFDGAGPALTGQDITGSVGFSLPGQAPRPDCVRLGVDVDYKLAADTLLNVSAHASTVGEVADVSGAISIRRAF
jgi:hypothetical protein